MEGLGKAQYGVKYEWLRRGRLGWRDEQKPDQRTECNMVRSNGNGIPPKCCQ